MASRLGNKSGLQITGIDDLRRTLAEMAPNEARNLARATVYGVAVRVRDRLQGRVTKRSGRLGQSIKVVRRRGRPDEPVTDVRGGATAPYMLMLEFGTSRTRAQPFIVPTIEEIRPELPAIYREEFGKKLEKALARQARKAAK